MHRISSFFILIFSLMALPAKAQYYTINIDLSTIEAMTAAFAAEASTEALHNENLQNIFDSYKAAEVASAGIFSSKYLDRQALTALDLWDSEQENKYYTRIYKIVAHRIIPKLITDAQLMIKDPATALYWGSYLVRTTNDVQSLCQQFESIVTNSRLSFNDIAFVKIAEEFSSIFNLTSLGNIDWKELFDHLGDDLEGAFSKDGLRADLDNLISKGVGLAGAGLNNGMNQLLSGTDFGGSFDNKVGSVITLVDNAKNMFDEYKNLSADKVFTSLVGKDNIDGLFNMADYNITKWITDYEKSAQGQYYTQRVYIYKVDAGQEVLCNYAPPSDDWSIANSTEWLRFDVQGGEAVNMSAALNNSEKYAGWNKSKVDELNKSGDGMTYSFDITPHSCSIRDSRNILKSVAAAYSILVIKKWEIREEVYEAVYDSYSMDWNTFIAEMNVRLNQYNANGDDANIASVEDLDKYITSHPTESNYTYYIGYDSKTYYSATDVKKLAGATSATFSLTCHGGGELGKGATTYKCKDCDKTLTPHTRECAMATTLGDDLSSDIGSLKSKLTECQVLENSLQSQIDALNAENTELLRKMSSASSTQEYDSYRNQYNANKAAIDGLNADLTSLRQDIKDLQAAIDEAEGEDKEETDDYTRIPQLMHSVQTTYGINWTDAGSWTGYTFTRKGTIGNIQGNLTFLATLSIVRKPQYFLGIRIHRAIVQIDWSLTSSWSDSSVAETMNLDTSKSDEENAAIINKRLSELALENPGCEVSVEIKKKAPIETDDGKDIYHLLWASDRLEIARQIEAKLARIYTDLVTIEKFLHYKHNILDYVKDLCPKLNADKYKKMNIAERSRRRWMHNVGSAYYAREEEDDNYDNVQ